MDIISLEPSNPPATIEYVRLPDVLPENGKTAFYDIHGIEDPQGTVMISTIAVNFIWARFTVPVKSNQVATMVFSNIPAATIADGAATEWDMATNQPTFGEAIVTLLSIERGVDAGRIICRNLFHADIWLAAGFGVPIFPTSALVGAAAS